MMMIETILSVLRKATFIKTENDKIVFCNMCIVLSSLNTWKYRVDNTFCLYENLFF